MFVLKSSEFQLSILTTSFISINTLKYLDLLHYLIEWIMGGYMNQKHLHVTIICLWSQVVCFVLSHWDLPNHGTSCHALGIFGKLLMSRVHECSLKLFGATVWNHFSMKIKSNQIKKLYWNLAASLVFLESPWWVRFNRLISQFSELRCGRYFFWGDFVAGNSNKLQKLGLERKISVHTWANDTWYTS
jgi:hypothetical protein